MYTLPYNIDKLPYVCYNESEWDGPEVIPGNASLEIADFADSLSISYKNVRIHFDTSKLDSKELGSLVRTLVRSFEFASTNNNTHHGD